MGDVSGKGMDHSLVGSIMFDTEGREVAVMGSLWDPDLCEEFLCCSEVVPSPLNDQPKEITRILPRNMLHKVQQAEYQHQQTGHPHPLMLLRSQLSRLPDPPSSLPLREPKTGWYESPSVRMHQDMITSALEIACQSSTQTQLVAVHKVVLYLKHKQADHLVNTELEEEWIVPSRTSSSTVTLRGSLLRLCNIMFLRLLFPLCTEILSIAESLRQKPNLIHTRSFMWLEVPENYHELPQVLRPLEGSAQAIRASSGWPLIRWDSEDILIINRLCSAGTSLSCRTEPEVFEGASQLSAVKQQIRRYAPLSSIAAIHELGKTILDESDPESAFVRSDIIECNEINDEVPIPNQPPGIIYRWNAAKSGKSADLFCSAGDRDFSPKKRRRRSGAAGKGVTALEYQQERTEDLEEEDSEEEDSEEEEEQGQEREAGFDSNSDTETISDGTALDLESLEPDPQLLIPIIGRQKAAAREFSNIQEKSLATYIKYRRALHITARDSSWKTKACLHCGDVVTVSASHIKTSKDIFAGKCVVCDQCHRPAHQRCVEGLNPTVSESSQPRVIHFGDVKYTYNCFDCVSRNIWAAKLLNPALDDPRDDNIEMLVLSPRNFLDTVVMALCSLMVEKHPRLTFSMEEAWQAVRKRCVMNDDMLPTNDFRNWSTAKPRNDDMKLSSTSRRGCEPDSFGNLRALRGHRPSFMALAVMHPAFDVVGSNQECIRFNPTFREEVLTCLPHLI